MVPERYAEARAEYMAAFGEMILACTPVTEKLFDLTPEELRDRGSPDSNLINYV
jgi:hypothetical protein